MTETLVSKANFNDLLKNVKREKVDDDIPKKVEPVKNTTVRLYSHYLLFELIQTSHLFGTVINKNNDDVAKLQKTKIPSYIRVVLQNLVEEIGCETPVHTNLISQMLDIAMSKYDHDQFIGVKIGILDFIATRIFTNGTSTHEILKKIVPKTFTFNVPSQETCECGYELSDFQKDCSNSTRSETQCTCKRKCIICYTVSYVRTLVHKLRNILSDIESSRSKHQTSSNPQAAHGFIARDNEGRVNELCNASCMIECHECHRSLCFSSIVRADQISKVAAFFLQNVYACESGLMNNASIDEMLNANMEVDPSVISQFAGETEKDKKIKELQQDLDYAVNQFNLLQTQLLHKDDIISELRRSELKNENLMASFEKMTNSVLATNSRLSVMLDNRNASDERTMSILEEVIQTSKRQRTGEFYERPEQTTTMKGKSYQGSNVTKERRTCSICLQPKHNRRSSDKCSIQVAIHEMGKGILQDINNLYKNKNRLQADQKLREVMRTPEFSTAWLIKFPGVAIPRFEKAQDEEEVEGEDEAGFEFEAPNFNSEI
jgi:hypothetical protein